MEITRFDVDALEVELLPDRAALQNVLVGAILIGASNTSTAVNALTAFSLAASGATQVIIVG